MLIVIGVMPRGIVAAGVVAGNVVIAPGIVVAAQAEEREQELAQDQGPADESADEERSIHDNLPSQLGSGSAVPGSPGYSPAGCAHIGRRTWSPGAAAL